MARDFSGGLKRPTRRIRESDYEDPDGTVLVSVRGYPELVERERWYDRPVWRTCRFIFGIAAGSLCALAFPLWIGDADHSYRTGAPFDATVEAAIAAVCLYSAFVLFRGSWRALRR